MAYASRLMEDSGRAAPAPGLGRATEAAASREAERAVPAGPPASFVPSAPPAETPMTAPSHQSSGQPGVVDTTAVAGAAASLVGQTDGRLKPAPAAADSLPVPGQTVEAAPEEVASLGQADARLETPEERVLRTIALVREWTSVTPVPDVVAVPPVIEETSVHSRIPPVDALEGPSPERPGEVVIRPRAERIVQAPAVFVEPEQSTPAAEPEVVNLNVSVGAIELILEAPNAPPFVPSALPATRTGPAAPDAEARLRRHYIRPSLGGW